MEFQRLGLIVCINGVFAQIDSDSGDIKERFVSDVVLMGSITSIKQKFQMKISILEQGFVHVDRTW